MLYSCQTSFLAARLGSVSAAADALMDAGYPAIDISLFGQNDYLFIESWQDMAKELRQRAEARGAVYNQAHAPFGGLIRVKVMETSMAIHKDEAANIVIEEDKES